MITPEVWGPHLWKSIHYISLGYPKEPTQEDKDNYKSFFENLWKVIPCDKCAINYKNHLKELPLNASDLETTTSLFYWTVHLHNIVNKEKGKKLISPKKALSEYVNTPRNSNIALYVIITILVLTICSLLFYIYKN